MSLRQRGVAILLPWALLLLTVEAFAVTTTRPLVLQQLPHDVEAFTEGLFVVDGSFFESTGLEGRSELREVKPSTGTVLRSVALSDSEFGEGIAQVGDSIWMLTWKNQIAHRYGVDDFSLLEDVAYEGEGWGLCFDGERLWMSDGSSSLQLRDPHSFELLGRLDVRRDGLPVLELNELECVGDYVYANVWRTDVIVQIEKTTGAVTSQIDAGGLLSPEDNAGVDVLNGIAYDFDSGHFFLTGKYWPKVFEVQFESASAPGTVTESGPNELALDGGVRITQAMADSSAAMPGQAAGQRGGCKCSVGQATGSVAVPQVLAWLSACTLLRRRFRRANQGIAAAS